LLITLIYFFSLIFNESILAQSLSPVQETQGSRSLLRIVCYTDHPSYTNNPALFVLEQMSNDLVSGEDLISNGTGPTSRYISDVSFRVRVVKEKEGLFVNTDAFEQQIENVIKNMNSEDTSTQKTREGSVQSFSKSLVFTHNGSPGINIDYNFGFNGGSLTIYENPRQQYGLSCRPPSLFNPPSAASANEEPTEIEK